MGIKGLSKLIGKYKKTDNLSIFKGKRIGIDTSLYVHKFCHISNKVNEQYKDDKEDKDGKDDKDVIGNGDADDIKKYMLIYFENFIKKFKKQSITPVFIFDNKSHKLKQDVIDKRNKMSDGKKVVKRCYFTDLQNMFDKNNIEYEISPELWEAEQYGSFLVKANKIHGFLSADLDSLVFGCSTLITNIKNKDTIEYYKLSDILENLEISFDKFILMCLIMGSDFNQTGLKNYGPVKALKYVQDNSISNIETLLEENMKNFQEIYSLFKKEFV